MWEDNIKMYPKSGLLDQLKNYWLLKTSCASYRQLNMKLHKAINMSYSSHQQSVCANQSLYHQATLSSRTPIITHTYHHAHKPACTPIITHTNHHAHLSSRTSIITHTYHHAHQSSCTPIITHTNHHARLSPRTPLLVLLTINLAALCYVWPIHLQQFNHNKHF